MSTNSEYKSDITNKLLWVFLIIIIFLFSYLVYVNKYIQNHEHYNATLHDMKILDKNFNSFLVQKSTFINYDDINAEINEYEQKIDFLQSEKSQNLFGKKYDQYVTNLLQHFQKKSVPLEYYKTQNSQMVDSIHYLFDINKAIQDSKLSQAIKDSTSNLLVDFMKYYINNTINTDEITKRVESLTPYMKENENIELFILHISLNLTRIQKISKIQRELLQEDNAQALETLHKYILNEYQTNIEIEKNIVSALFIVALFLLFILILTNKKAIHMRNDLQSFKTAIENSYNSIVITDTDSKIIYVNEMVLKESGYTKKELIGQNPSLFKSGLNNEDFYKELHSSLNAGVKWEGEFINKRKDGTLFYEKASIMPIYKNNQVSSFLAIKLNITDYIEEKDKVEHMAYHDSLTGLVNKLSVEKYLANRLPYAKRNNIEVALLFIDLDRFKTINDTLGHDVGDELLIECAKRFRSGLRETDVLARVGGDEFVIILESVNKEHSAAYVSQKLLELFNTPIQTQNHLLSVTLSIGISLYPQDSGDYKKLFKYADIAMYEAKKSGKNTYKYYQENLSLEAHDRLHIEQSLKFALQNDEISMNYQPQYRLKDREILGLEALVRWNNKTDGFISPDRFIPIAEETGYIIEIGHYIFEQSLKDYLLFKEHSKSLKSISINISAVQLYQDDFIEKAIALTNKYGINPNEIVLEITETHIMRNIEQSRTFLQELKDLNFKISIDDFGTGHSSLNYLKLFPIDELKIDKTFVDDLPNIINDVAISKAILTLSQSMNYTNVGEGIENQEQEDFLKENNCLLGQGYHFCKPQSKEKLIAFLDSLHD